MTCWFKPCGRGSQAGEKDLRQNPEKIEREIEQLELALEDFQVAMAEADETAGPDDDAEADIATPSIAEEEKLPRRRPRISKDAPCERRELDPGDSCPDCGGDLAKAFR